MNEFLVIDFGDTEIRPAVYLINKRNKKMAEALIRNTKEDIGQIVDGDSFCKLVEDKWRIFRIWYHKVGSIKLSYVNRQREYLPENTIKVVL